MSRDVTRGRSGGNIGTAMSVERRPKDTKPRNAEERALRELELRRRKAWIQPETRKLIAEGRRRRDEQAKAARKARKEQEPPRERGVRWVPEWMRDE